MASTALHFLSHPKPLNFCTNRTSQTPAAIQSDSLLLLPCFSNQKHSTTTIKCTSNTTPQINFPDSNSKPQTENQPQDQFDIQKRQRKSEIIRDRKSSAGLVKPEPKNFEIGWKRTKEIKLEKPKGYVIADFLEKLEGLMERGDYESSELLAKTGEIVAERAREDKGY